MNKIMTLAIILCSCCANAQPVIKGGLESFIRANLSYPAFSYQNCVQGIIKVNFKVNLAGEVYSSKVSSGLGIDLDQEALRLIRLSSGKWKVPADYDTTYVLIAPVSFKIASVDCNQVGQQEINNAIAAYKTNEGLTDAITNFYRNKDTAKYSKADEDKIIALKKELGYDNEYLQKRLKEGEKKLKQKDKQGACEDFLFIRYMGSDLADALLEKYCR